MHSNPVTIELFAHMRHAELQAEAAQARLVRQGLRVGPAHPGLATTTRPRLGSGLANAISVLRGIGSARRRPPLTPTAQPH
jgi:hypothetical protein